MRTFLSVAIYLIPILTWATPTLEQQIEDLHQLKTIVAEDYGPLQMKRQLFGLDLENLTKSYEMKLASARPDEDFRYTLKQFVAEFRDSHFTAKVLSENSASLGFTVELVQGKVLIEEVDRTVLNETSFPFSRGDEVVSFDGQPVAKMIAQLQTFNGMGSEETARRLAVYSLPNREAKLLPVPTGSALVGVRKHDSGVVVEVSLPWKGKTPAPALRITKEKAEFKGPIGKGYWCSEKSRIAPPAGAEIIGDVPFTAFIFPSEKGPVGFIRIPHYYPVDQATGKEVAALRFQQYEKVIQRFETETIGLIIDQDYNCGGSILFVNKMLSLFLPNAFTPAEFEFRTSQGQIDGLSRHLAKFSQGTDGYGKFSDLIDGIKTAKAQGLFLSPKIPVWGVMEVDLKLPGVDRVEPNPILYTKPIVLLVNEMSGSGGDLFPAMMKDLGRAHLLGHHTMGAGGHAWDDPPLELKHSKIKLSVTRSLIYRPNGALIENAGIEPDTAYEISMDDFMNGYSSYLGDATQRLLDLTASTRD